MAQRNSKPLTWRPKGLSDTLDASSAFNGAMASLQNLIPDPTTADLWQCRPAAQKIADFFLIGGAFSSAFSTAFQLGLFNPGFISCIKTVGALVYGMVATSLNPGQDQPFCYSILTGQFINVAGATNVNTPLSPATSGAWTPPTMALVGAKMIVTHPGFNGTGGNFFGWFDVSDPANPVWHAGNLTGALAFTVAPSFVAQFNGQAYYIHNAVAQPGVIFSDVLNPTVATNGTQVLTFGDTTLLTALGGLPLNNQLGGKLQALIVFKGVTNLYQITGDAALATLASNALNIATGTLAPNSLCTTPKGLAFVSPEGTRVIDFNANVSDPIGVAGNGIAVPFQFAVVPSRVSAGCNGSIYRASMQNGNKTGSPNEEYWYDFARNIWHGPHTLPMSLYAPYLNTFIVTPIAATASLWQSDTVQSLTSTYVENAAQMTFAIATPLLPDLDMMRQTSVTEIVADVAFSSAAPAFTCQFLDQNGVVIDSVTIGPTAASTVWGAFLWNAANWLGASNALAPRQLQWHIPLVFARGALSITGQCAQGIKFGAFHMRYQELGYTSNTQAAA